MSTGHMPSGSEYSQAAAWMLIAVSIIMLIMALVRCWYHKYYGGFESIGEGMFRKLPNFMKGKWHTVLYWILFALVLASALSFFFN